jgi:hypothetical protein
VDAIAVGVEHLLERRTDPEAERALKVGELDDLDRRVFRPARRARRRHRHLLPRRVEQDPHRRLALQIVDVLPADLLHPLLGQERADRLPHLLEGSAPHLRRVGLVPGRDLGVGDRRHLRGDLLFDECGAVDALRFRGVVHQCRRDDLLERAAARVVERLRQLAAEVRGRRFERLVIHLRERDRLRPHGGDDVGRRRPAGLLG